MSRSEITISHHLNWIVHVESSCVLYGQTEQCFYNRGAKLLEVTLKGFSI
jgi:hypothetical protein